MSEDETKKMPPTFEDRVLSDLQTLISRVGLLEEKFAALDRETKPNWSRLHKDFAEHSADVKLLLGDLNRKLGVISAEMLQLKADQVRDEKRIDKIELETRPHIIAQDKDF